MEGCGEIDARFVFAGKDLREGQPLRRYGLGRDSTVHMLGRLRGGAQLGKVVKGRSQVRARSKPVARGRLECSTWRRNRLGVGFRLALG